MKLPNDIPTQHEKQEKKRKTVLISLISLLGVLAVISVILLVVTVVKMKNEAAQIKAQEVTELTRAAQATAAAQKVTPDPDKKVTEPAKATDTPTPKATDTPVPKATDTPVPTKEPTKEPTAAPTAEPTASAVATVTPDPNRGPTVMLDPGHGGSDGGCAYWEKTINEDGKAVYHEKRDGNGNKVWECDIVLAIGLKVREKLQASGVTVLMTREIDTYFDTPTNRMKYASQSDIDAFVSIHLNSAPTKDDHSTHGTEIWYNSDYNVNSGKLANLILEELLKLPDSKNRYAKNDSVEGNELAIPKCSHPTCLVECEFLSADGVFEKLITEEYQDQVAEGITNGILKYLDWAGIRQ